MTGSAKMECVRGENFDAKRGFETSDALTISFQSTDPGQQRVIRDELSGR
jgi:hypothetical protein